MTTVRLKCKHCGATIERRELSEEAAQWRGGRRVIWLDLYGSAKTTGLNGHYHEPEED